MSQSLRASTNKQRGGYSARPVFHPGGVAVLGNFAARDGGAKGRGGSGWAIRSRVPGGVDGGLLASTPPHTNQWLSDGGEAQVARVKLHAASGMADFCRFPGLRRHINSYQTARREGHRGASRWAKMAVPGGLSPFDLRADPCPGRAGQSQLWAETCPLPLAYGGPEQRSRFCRGVIIRPVPMGSGVRVASMRLPRGKNAAGALMARKEALILGCGDSPLWLGLGAMIESGRR